MLHSAPAFFGTLRPLLDQNHRLKLETQLLSCGKDEKQEISKELPCFGGTRCEKLLDWDFEGTHKFHIAKWAPGIKR